MAEPTTEQYVLRVSRDYTRPEWGGVVILGSHVFVRVEAGVPINFADSFKLASQLVEAADRCSALSAENARLITERDQAFAEHGVESGFWGRAAARATQRSERLEAENARLREALQDMADEKTCEDEPGECYLDSGPYCGAHGGFEQDYIKQARAALTPPPSAGKDRKGEVSSHDE